MAEDNLENKVKEEVEVTKDIVRNFPYFKTALLISKNMPGKEAAEYVCSAMDIISKNAKDGQIRFLAEGLGNIAARDYNSNGTLTNTTYGFLSDKIKLYNEKVEKTNLNELVEIAKGFGYNESRPEFLNEYMQESMTSLAEKGKGKEKDEDHKKKMECVKGAYAMLNDIIIRKSDNNIRDFMTEKTFKLLQNEYSQIGKKEERDSKAEQSEQESDKED